MSIATDLIKKYEGCRLTAYQDILGLWTCGWGHLLSQNNEWGGYTITQEQADLWLSQDVAKAQGIAKGFPHWDLMNEVRQAVLTSMTFQMGTKPLRWPHFMAALEAQDYTAAAIAGLDSEWAIQTPKRAEEEMDMLEKG
jgi:lysozyme